MTKVRLHVDSFELSGYTNKLINSIDDTLLMEYDNGELDELILDNVLDFLPIDKAEDVLSRLSKLLKKGGTLIVTGMDLYEVCKAFTSYHTDIAQTNKLIFGENPERSRRLAFTTPSLVNFLNEVAKLKVLKKRVNNYYYAVEAVRP